MERGAVDMYSSDRQFDATQQLCLVEQENSANCYRNNDSLAAAGCQVAYHDCHDCHDCLLAVVRLVTSDAI